MSTVPDPRDIIVAPVVSEKSYSELNKNWYTFLVHPDANKTAIKIAIQQIFDVQANIPLMHQVVVAQLAAARQGTHKVKRRGEVSGGGCRRQRQDQ